jgi:hypothetical protein
VTLADFGYPVSRPFGFIAPKTLNYLASQSFEEIQSQQKKKKKKSHGRSASFGQGDHVANAKNIHVNFRILINI